MMSEIDIESYPFLMPCFMLELGTAYPHFVVDQIQDSIIRDFV